MTGRSPGLTASEREVMDFLWDYGEPLTAAGIIARCPERKWKDSYIHLIIQSLLKKKTIEVAGFEATTKNYARTFSPALTREDFLIRQFLEDYPINERSALVLAEYLLDGIDDPDIIRKIRDICGERLREIEDKR